MASEVTLDDLTEQHRLFLENWLALGAVKGKGSEAMRMTNPELTEGSAQATASRYMRDPKTLAALRNLADSGLRAAAVLAQDTLCDMMEGVFNGQVVKPEVALKACVEILNRSGLVQVSKHEHHHLVEDHRSENELLAHIKQRMEQLEIAGAIDTECEEVDGGAPYGRRLNGAPKKKPGPEPYKLRLTPPPEKDPEEMTDKERRLHEERERVKRIREQLKAARSKKTENENG